jgi:hypothetical protein
MTLIKLIKEEYLKIPICHFNNQKKDPGSNENLVRTLPSDEITTGMVKTLKKAP